MKVRLFLVLTCFLTFLSVVKPAHAAQPVVEQRKTAATRDSDPYQLYDSAMPVGDPTFSSYTIYGSLDQNSIDMYYFVPRQEEVVPIELTVPAKPGLSGFLPRLLIVGKYVANGAKNPSDIPVPISFESVAVDTPAARPAIYDSLSLQRLYRGTTQATHVIPGETYFLAVMDPAHAGGSYAIRLGTKNNFSGSVKDTATTIDTNNLAFENYPAAPINGAPTAFEQKFFQEQKTPFQTFDTRLRLWIDFTFFYFNRIIALITNQ